MTNDVHVPSIDNLELQTEQFRELPAEELEMVSGGFSWSDIVNIIRQPLPIIASLF